MSQVPLPLEYKLKQIKDKSPADMFNPLGVSESLPFNITRTVSGNLPIYNRYRYGRTQ